MISRELAIEFEALQAELEELKQAIREACTLDDLNDLHHRVGPSEDEQRKASERLAMIDAIDKKCAWEKFEAQCSLEELRARGQWNAIMNVQGAFENKYC